MPFHLPFTFVLYFYISLSGFGSVRFDSVWLRRHLSFCHVNWSYNYSYDKMYAPKYKIRTKYERMIWHIGVCLYASSQIERYSEIYGLLDDIFPLVKHKIEIGCFSDWVKNDRRLFLLLWLLAASMSLSLSLFCKWRMFLSKLYVHFWITISSVDEIGANIS